jgi:hypothetical protein
MYKKAFKIWDKKASLKKLRLPEAPKNQINQI